MAKTVLRQTTPCRSCGTEIAANALICYRCGTATTEARLAPPPPSSMPSRRALFRLLVLLAIGAVIVRVVACGSLL